MSSPDHRHIAVFDVGKTNKKLHVYDEELRLVDTQSTTFDPVLRGDVAFYDMEAILGYYTDALTRVSTRFDIKLITVATQGATFACLGADGKLSVPIIDYTHEPGDEFHRQFYELAGSPDQLQVETATLELKALVNTAQGIHFLKMTYPNEFARTTDIVLFPQFFSHWLSGKICADFTYAGCHSYLFDYATQSWSGVTDRLGIRELMPDLLVDAGTVVGRIKTELAERTGILPGTLVTAGVHDSNASLLPYLVKKQDADIIVNSTGTWCVAMHPAERVAFGDDEIGKAVFFNMSVLRTPVKTSILMGGLEYETWTEFFPVELGSSTEVYRSVLAENSEFIIPGVVAGTGQFPDATPGVHDHGEWYPLDAIRSGDVRPPLFSDPVRAISVLNLSLALQTRVALQRVGLTSGTAVYTEGGFRNNGDYNTILASLCPDTAFFLSGMDEATSFGAALLGWARLDEGSPFDLSDRFAVVEEPVVPLDLRGLESYASRFAELASQ